MKTTYLSWYVAVMLVLLAVAASAVSYVPEARRSGDVLAASLGVVATFAVTVAIWIGRLRADHPVRTSKTVVGAYVAAAVTVTVLMVLVG